MKPFNVKVVARVKGDSAGSQPSNNRLRQLVGAAKVKLLGWDKSDLHIRQLDGGREEISLVMQLTPTPIKQRKTP